MKKITILIVLTILAATGLGFVSGRLMALSEMLPIVRETASQRDKSMAQVQDLIKADATNQDTIHRYEQMALTCHETIDNATNDLVKINKVLSDALKGLK